MFYLFLLFIYRHFYCTHGHRVWAPMKTERQFWSTVYKYSHWKIVRIAPCMYWLIQLLTSVNIIFTTSLPRKRSPFDFSKSRITSLKPMLRFQLRYPGVTSVDQSSESGRSTRLALFKCNDHLLIVKLSCLCFTINADNLYYAVHE